MNNVSNFFLNFKFVLVLLIIFFFNPPQVNSQDVLLKPAFSKSFKKPVFMTPYPIKYTNLQHLMAIVEQDGKIILSQLLKKERANLLDFTPKICTIGSEEGLLGLAFSPQYSINKSAYIYYSHCSSRKKRESIISRLTITENHNADVDSVKKLNFSVSEKIILKIPQPYSNHNGGMLAFGADGYLYIGVGDGGSAGDPHNYAQNKSSLLGKVLRIDVDSTPQYQIPIDNPFNTKIEEYKKRGSQVQLFRSEIFAYGIRNPWRFSFDNQNRLILGDVGQNRYEEIHIIQKGKNYGWRIMEGSYCYRPKKNCNTNGLEKPVFEYPHSLGQSIVGGYVYQGTRQNSFLGKYIFGDTIQGKIWMLDLNTKKVKELVNTRHYISSFAEDHNKELYVLDLLGGIYHLETNKNIPNSQPQEIIPKVNSSPTRIKNK